LSDPFLDRLLGTHQLVTKFRAGALGEKGMGPAVGSHFMPLRYQFLHICPVHEVKAGFDPPSHEKELGLDTRAGKQRERVRPVGIMPVIEGKAWLGGPAAQTL